MIRASLLLVVGFGAFVPGTALARELWSRGDASLEVTGSIRNLARFTKGTDADDFAQQGAPCFLDAAAFPDCPAFGLVGDKDVGVDLTRLRTRFDLTMSPNLSAQVTYDNELRFGTLDTLEAALGQSLASDTFLDLQWDVEGLGFGSDEPHRRWRHLLYRAFLRYQSDQIDVVVGRQRIAWGGGAAVEPDRPPQPDPTAGHRARSVAGDRRRRCPLGPVGLHLSRSRLGGWRHLGRAGLGHALARRGSQRRLLADARALLRGTDGRIRPRREPG